MKIMYILDGDKCPASQTAYFRALQMGWSCHSFVNFHLVSNRVFHVFGLWEKVGGPGENTNSLLAQQSNPQPS